MDEVIKVAISILSASLSAALLLIGSKAWELLKQKISESRYKKFFGVVEPIFLSVLRSDKFKNKLYGAIDKEGPGGRWITEEELKELGREVWLIAKPQLSRLTGFALEYGEEEVTALVRRFFTDLRGYLVTILSNPEDIVLEKLPELANSVAMEE